MYLSFTFLLVSCFYYENFCFLPYNSDTKRIIQPTGTYVSNKRNTEASENQLDCQEDDDINNQGHLKLIRYGIKYDMSPFCSVRTPNRALKQKCEHRSFLNQRMH
jgi:hypothetical protein